MFGCVELYFGSAPSTKTTMDDNAVDNSKSSNATNSGSADTSNNNELVENTAASTALSVATLQNKGRCPFRQCISDTFDPCRPPAITDNKSTPSSPFIANDDQTHTGTPTKTPNAAPESYNNLAFSTSTKSLLGLADPEKQTSLSYARQVRRATISTVKTTMTTTTIKVPHKKREKWRKTSN